MTGRIADLERDLAAMEESLSNERDDAEDRVSRVKRELAAAQRIAEDNGHLRQELLAARKVIDRYAEVASQTTKLADKAMARAEHAKYENERRYMRIAQLEARVLHLRENVERAEADSARLDHVLETAASDLGPVYHIGNRDDIDASMADDRRVSEQQEAKL